MIDKEQFLKARLVERDVDLDGVGTVRVRGMSRAEMAKLRDYEERPDDGEIWMLSVCLLDPKLTEDEVRTWYGNAPADEVEKVADAVADLSGLSEEIQKAKEARFHGRQ